MAASSLLFVGGTGCTEDGPAIDVGNTELYACSQSESPTVDTGNYPANIVELTAASAAVFQGTVTQLNATTFDYAGFDLDTTIVVSPSSIFTSIELPAQVTVAVDQVSQYSLGQDAVFFVNSWVVGEGVGVVENAHLLVTDYPGLGSAMPAIFRFIEERALHKKLTNADMVFTASVGDVEFLGGGLDSEHDPQWAEAELLVNDVACGTGHNDTGVLRFASSTDVLWFEAPKIAAGESALFIAQADQVSGLGGDAFVVLDPAEVRPTGELSAIAELLATPPALDLSAR